MTEDEEMVTLKDITIGDLIKEMKQWPQDDLAGVSIVSIFDKESPKYTRLYFLEADEKNRAYISGHQCWCDNGQVVQDGETEENHE